MIHLLCLGDSNFVRWQAQEARRSAEEIFENPRGEEWAEGLVTIGPRMVNGGDGGDGSGEHVRFWCDNQIRETARTATNSNSRRIIGSGAREREERWKSVSRTFAPKRTKHHVVYMPRRTCTCAYVWFTYKVHCVSYNRLHSCITLFLKRSQSRSSIYVYVPQSTRIYVYIRAEERNLEIPSHGWSHFAAAPLSACLHFTLHKTLYTRLSLSPSHLFGRKKKKRGIGSLATAERKLPDRSYDPATPISPRSIEMEEKKHTLLIDVCLLRRRNHFGPQRNAIIRFNGKFRLPFLCQSRL